MCIFEDGRIKILIENELLNYLMIYLKLRTENLKKALLRKVSLLLAHDRCLIDHLKMDGLKIDCLSLVEIQRQFM